jgi:hypothetical protein
MFPEFGCPILGSPLYMKMQYTVAVEIEIGPGELLIERMHK